MKSMASQISQLVDVVSQLDTHLLNVRNISDISVVSCIESFSTDVLEPMVEIVDAVGAEVSEEKTTNSLRRRGVSFDPPLNLNSYMHVASFPSKLVVAKRSVVKEEVTSVHSSGDVSLTGKGRKVWIEVPPEERKRRRSNKRQLFQVIFL